MQNLVTRTYMVDIKDCDNNGWKHELDETTTSIINFLFKP